MVAGVFAGVPRVEIFAVECYRSTLLAGVFPRAARARSRLTLADRGAARSSSKRSPLERALRLRAHLRMLMG